jgi:asparaginyl-tRNA synthetase
MRKELSIGTGTPVIQNDASGEDGRLFEHFLSKPKDMQRLRGKLLYQTLCFFNNLGYMFIDPPILHEHIPNRDKSIVVSLYNKQYDLNESNALYISAYATVFEKVFALSPAFRDEEKSNNHLVEFRILECESSNSDFQQCIDLTQNYIAFILKAMAEQFTGSIFEKRLCLLQESLRFDTMTYKDLITLLQSGNISINYGDDLSDCDLEVSKILNCPTFIVDYPYPPATWTALPKDNGTTYTFNLLLPDGYGELAEGCQRNNDYLIFEKKFKEAGLPSLMWYAEAIKRNPCIRSGFGVGFERLIGWLAGVNSIRETVIFSREGR